MDVKAYWARHKYHILALGIPDALIALFGSELWHESVEYGAFGVVALRAIGQGGHVSVELNLQHGIYVEADYPGTTVSGEGLLQSIPGCSHIFSSELHPFRPAEITAARIGCEWDPQ